MKPGFVIVKNDNLKSRAVIFGSVGVNRGDDLMNRVIHNACVKAGYDVSIASIDPVSYEAIYKGDIFSSSKTNVLNWIRRIRKADCVIVGGGTMIQNDFGRTGFSGILLYASAVLTLATILRVPRIYVIGVGINKINRRNRFFAQFFKLAHEILVRDVASAENAHIIGLSKRVTASYDVALAASLYDKVFEESSLSSIAVCEEPYICISIAKEKSEAAAYSLARGLVFAAVKAGLRIKLVAMDIREGEELGIYRKLKDEFNLAVNIIIPDNPFGLIPLLRNARLCVGMRLHFCVLSVVAGQKVVVISREQKTEWLAEFVGEERLLNFFSTNVGDRVAKIISQSLECSNLLDESARLKLRNIDDEIALKLHMLLQQKNGL